jgi:polyisoprenoid-binding protein YceI
MFKKYPLIALVALLASCAAPVQRPPAAKPPVASTALPGAGTYRIDPNGSELRVLVYRAGALANLGHNHVMVNRNLSGSIVIGRTLTDSHCTVSVPVSEFSVDDADARRAEGPEFASEVAADAKAGTLHNMLSAPVLNAADNPTIEITSISFDQSHGVVQATLQVRIAGHQATVTAPFTYLAQPQALSASAEFELKQSALGMTPYSLMLGALSVRDTMLIKIKLAGKIS